MSQLLIYRFTTAQKTKFSIKDFFIKCDQIRSFLRIWSYLLKKSLMVNFIFCVVYRLTSIRTFGSWFVNDPSDFRLWFVKLDMRQRIGPKFTFSYLFMQMLVTWEIFLTLRPRMPHICGFLDCFSSIHVLGTSWRF